MDVDNGAHLRNDTIDKKHIVPWYEFTVLTTKQDTEIKGSEYVYVYKLFYHCVESLSLRDSLSLSLSLSPPLSLSLSPHRDARPLC